MLLSKVCVFVFMSLADPSLLSLLYKLLKVNIVGVFSSAAFPVLCILLYSFWLKPMKHLYLEDEEILTCGSVQTPLDHALGRVCHMATALLYSVSF